MNKLRSLASKLRARKAYKDHFDSKRTNMNQSRHLWQLLCVVATVHLAGCAGKQVKTPAWTDIRAQVENHVDLNKRLDLTQTTKLIRDLEREIAIAKRTGKRSAKLKALAAEFIAQKRQLKYREFVLAPGPAIAIPPRSEITIPFHWWCLEASKATPKGSEFNEWSTVEESGIPYYSEVLKYGYANKVPAAQLQSLLWNLGRKVPFADYPAEQQNILREIDPSAPTKMVAKDLGRSVLSKVGSVLGRTDIGRTVGDISSQYQDYSKTLNSLLGRTSKIAPLKQGLPSQIFDSGVFTHFSYKGSFNTVITFYNTQVKPVVVNLPYIVLKPERKDVQKQALIPNRISENEKNISRRMDVVEQENKPYIYPPSPPQPNDTIDIAPEIDPPQPYVYPEGETGPLIIIDTVPEQKPPQPYLNEPTGLKEGDVGSYEENKNKGKVGDGLEMDHIPSFAAIKAAEERRLGEELSPEEERRLYNESATMAVKEELHRAGRTHGGKNNRGQIERDSRDLEEAAKKDIQAHLDNADRLGSDRKSIEENIEKLHDLNRRLGRY